MTKWIGQKKLDENRLDENWAHGDTYGSRSNDTYGRKKFNFY